MDYVPIHIKEYRIHFDCLSSHGVWGTRWLEKIYIFLSDFGVLGHFSHRTGRERGDGGALRKCLTTLKNKYMVQCCSGMAQKYMDTC